MRQEGKQSNESPNSDNNEGQSLSGSEEHFEWATARDDKKPRCRTEVDRRVGELKIDERYRNIFRLLVREVVASIGIHPVSRDAL